MRPHRRMPKALTDAGRISGTVPTLQMYNKSATIETLKIQKFHSCSLKPTPYSRNTPLNHRFTTPIQALPDHTRQFPDPPCAHQTAAPTPRQHILHHARTSPHHAEEESTEAPTPRASLPCKEPPLYSTRQAGGCRYIPIHNAAPPKSPARIPAAAAHSGRSSPHPPLLPGREHPSPQPQAGCNAILKCFSRRPKSATRLDGVPPQAPHPEQSRKADGPPGYAPRQDCDVPKPLRDLPHKPHALSCCHHRKSA